MSLRRYAETHRLPWLLAALDSPCLDDEADADLRRMIAALEAVVDDPSAPKAVKAEARRRLERFDP